MRRRREAVPLHQIARLAFAGIALPGEGTIGLRQRECREGSDGGVVMPAGRRDRVRIPRALAPVGIGGTFVAGEVELPAVVVEDCRAAVVVEGGADAQA